MSSTVDKDMQHMLFPLNLMQYFIFRPKYRIKNDFITPNTLLSNFVSMVVTLLFISLYILYNYLVYLNSRAMGYTNFMYISIFYSTIFFCIGFSMNFWIGVMQTKNHIQFVLTIQKVHRFLNKESSYKHFIIWNWILVIIALSFYACIYTSFVILLEVPFQYLYVSYFLVVFDFNTVYATRLMKVLESKVVLWNIQAMKPQVFEEIHEKKYCSKLFQTYVDIMKCYDLYKVGFQQFILYKLIHVVLQSLSSNQWAIDAFKVSIAMNKMDGLIIMSLCVFCWLIKDLVWQTMFIRQCEKFYFAIQSVQDTCAVILKSTCSDDEKILCKNVLRLHRASFSKIRACGLFYVDTALLLSLMSLLTNYTFVLLQFAFL